MTLLSVFFSTRRGLEVPLLKELQTLLPSSSAAGPPQALLADLPQGSQTRQSADASQNDSAFPWANQIASAAPECQRQVQLQMVSGGVLAQRVSPSLLPVLCCGVRTAERAWLRVWGPVPCASQNRLVEQVHDAILKYVHPLAALPLLPFRVASRGSSLGDTPSLREAVRTALSQAAEARAPTTTTPPSAAPLGQARSDFSENALAEADARAAAATLAAAGHRLRLVLVRDNALLDLQISNALAPRPFRYLHFFPAAAAKRLGSETESDSLTPSLPVSALREKLLHSATAFEEKSPFNRPPPVWSLAAAVHEGGASASLAEGREARPRLEGDRVEGRAVGRGQRTKERRRFLSIRNQILDAVGTAAAETSEEALLKELRSTNHFRQLPSERETSPRLLMPSSACAVELLRLRCLRLGVVGEALEEAAKADAAEARETQNSESLETQHQNAALWTSAGKRAFCEASENDVSLAAAVSLMGLKRIFKREKKLVLWDPFCGSGDLLLEALMTLFSLPPSLPSLPSPLNEAPAFADLAAAAAEAERTIEEKDPCSEATSALRGELTLVGSDWRPLALHAARHRLRAFCDFYFDGATPMDPEEQLQTNALGKPLPIANNGQGKKTPFALSFHLCTPFEVAPFLSGAFVLTRIPDTRDMKGSAFANCSSLRWEEKLHWKTVSGKPVRLLKWTGRRRENSLSTEIDELANQLPLQL